jgi:hypothetical protein
MPYKTEAQGYRIPPELDARRKLDDDDRAKIRALRAADPVQWSARALAREFNVSRRLIQFILDPAKHAENLKRRAERGGVKIDTARQTAHARKYRARKYQLFKEGKIKRHEDA